MTAGEDEDLPQCQLLHVEADGRDIVLDLLSLDEIEVAGTTVRPGAVITLGFLPIGLDGVDGQVFQTLRAWQETAGIFEFGVERTNFGFRYELMRGEDCLVFEVLDRR